MYSDQRQQRDDADDRHFDVRPIRDIGPHAHPVALLAVGAPEIPADVRNFGVTVQKSLSTPFLFFALSSPHGTYDNVFLANYAYINLVDPALHGSAASRTSRSFGAGQYAMRLWVKPDRLSQLNLTIPESWKRREQPEQREPGRPIGSIPCPGDRSSPTPCARGSAGVGRAIRPDRPARNPDGSLVRLRDVRPHRAGRPGLTTSSPASTASPPPSWRCFLLPGRQRQGRIFEPPRNASRD